MASATKPQPVALYYPHTRVQTESILKAGLLLWDYVDTILPGQPLVDADVRRLSNEAREAEELLIKHRVPTLTEKKSVHRKVETLLKNGIPEWVRQDFVGADSRHRLMYPGKLSAETWNLLRTARLARLVGEGGRDYQLPPALGLFLMSMLADECAGTTRRKVTDVTQAYLWLMRVMTESLGGEFRTTFDAADVAPNYERLVTIAAKTINTDDIPIERLLEMRKREAREASKDYAELRRQLLQRVSDYVKRLSRAGNSKSDLREIHRQYREDMTRDLRELKRELWTAAAKVAFKDIGVAVLAVPAAMVNPLAGLAGVGALVYSHAEYRQARRKALKQHAMSWLYLAEAGGLPVL